MSSSLAVSGGSVVGLIKRIFKPAKKRWEGWVFVNILCAVILAWFVVINTFTNFWRIGVDPQDVRCLPYTYFLIGQKLPEAVERGGIYRFRTWGMAPIAKDGTPMVKYAAAVAGDKVRVDATGIYINENKWGDLNPYVMKKTHFDVVKVTRNFVVAKGHVLMLGTLPRSFDGRYTGPIPLSRIDGKAVPLW